MIEIKEQSPSPTNDSTKTAGMTYDHPHATDKSIYAELNMNTTNAATKPIANETVVYSSISHALPPIENPPVSTTKQNFYTEI